VSIRARLTIWYTGVLAATLIIFGLGLYSLLSQILYEDIDDTLQTRAQQIGNYIQTQSNPLDLLITRQVQLPPVDVFSSATVFVQILNTKGEVAARSANLGTRLLPIEDSRFAQNMEGLEVVYSFSAPSTHLRIYSAPLSVNDPLRGDTIIGAVQVGMSLLDVEGILQNTRSTLILAVAITSIIAAVIGAFMARTALLPIDRVTQTALQITRAEDLSRRLPTTDSQDELSRLTDTFNEMLGRLETLFQQQQRLVADVSHELRTPLTTLRGNLDLMKRGMGALGVDDVRDMLVTMDGEIARMSRLVSDLLLLAKADAGVELERKVVELDTVLLEVYRQGLMMADGVKIELGHEDQAVVLGDRDRLQQVLINLIDNAIKYTPAGGVVRLSLYKREGWVQVSVSDTGVGIPRKDLPHIFDRFYRSDRARTRQSGGAGLGLSIAKWIAEGHGGHLTVESEEGNGSTFTLWLRPLDDHSFEQDE
jgi:two-component system, OmpR family, sensor kinase